MHRIKHLGFNAIKESFDRLPTAVCFFDRIGNIVLCNRQMYRLSRYILDSDMQYLGEVAKALYALPNGIVKIPDLENTYRFPDKSVWKFEKTKVTDRYGEAVITAKAGTKTATCTVSVTCAHSALRPVAEKASNCTEKGWDAYKKCDLCGKLFDMSGNPISEIPYRALNTDHDFNTSEWGYKAADGHAHACRHNAEHHDDVQPHIRDHEGGATYDYAVKCSVCNYVIEPQLEAGNIRIEVPFKLNVKKTGEKDPGKETFKFAVERFGAPVEYTVVQDTVETNGEKTYDGKFIFTIRANLAGNLSEGFVIRQVKGNAEGWTYDETKFYAIPTFADSYSNGAAWSFLKYDENAELDYNNPIEEIGFTNSYNAKKPVTPPSPQNNESPKTGNGSMIGLWFALLFVSGAAMTGTVMYSRKRKANNR